MCILFYVNAERRVGCLLYFKYGGGGQGVDIALCMRDMLSWHIMACSSKSLTAESNSAC